MKTTTGSAQTGAAVAMIIGSCVSLQFGAATAVHLFGDLGSWGTTQLRLGFAALILTAIVRPSVRGWTRHQWRSVVAFGVVLAAMNGCFYAAIERIPLGTAVAIEFLGPLILSATLSRRRADLLWVGLAFVGMVLLGVDSIVGTSTLDLVGVGFALSAALFWAGYIVASARVGVAVPGTGGLAAALVVSTIVMLPLGGVAAAPAFADWRILAYAAATAVLASLIPYTLELSALRRIPKNVFGVLLSLEPAIAAAVGFVLLHQPVGILPAAAIAAVIAASIGTTTQSTVTGAAKRGRRVETPPADRSYRRYETAAEN
ncbi:DMT transporter permease [Gordonia spumicola]|uniref:DMT transporter permease n=1 Tax=Gordonia spumicola TaxID=589161 RepID=A0A7I9V8L1_9ACTN|nr:EamA family transporter [Gordonia spumicola]GEE01726.1 DMT transporter permease [Gordonia spumicola]